MTQNNPTQPETSVMFSLAELADIEQERVREEQELQRDRERAKAAAIAADREARAAAEAARIAADQERRAGVERQKAEAKARATAREKAELEVARIAAEAKVRLEADAAARAHELALLGKKNDKSRARLRFGLAGVLAAVVLGGSAAGWSVNGKLNALEHQGQKLREDRWALTQTHERALAAELSMLDRRHASLKQRAVGRVTEQARLRAEAARSAIEASGLDAAKLTAFGDALDTLDGRVQLASRIQAAYRRFADLHALAKANDKTAAADKAQAARSRTRGDDADAQAAKDYEGALDGLVTALRKSDSRRGRPTGRGRTSTSTSTSTSASTTGVCTNPHDPMCGLDGKLLGN